MKVVKLAPQEILKHWTEIEPALARALRHSVGESTTFDLFQWLMNPEYAQCWVVFEGDIPVNVSVTKVNKYAQHTSLHLITTTSLNGKSWNDYKLAHHAIEDYARSIGAKRLEGYGRPGWKRLAKKLKGKHGEVYEESYIVMSMFLKEIKNDNT